MTGAQHERLRKIQDELKTFAERRGWGMEIHPSPHMQKAFENYSSAQLENAAARIQFILDADNSQMAHAIIGVWHDGGEASVVRYVNGIYPGLQKANV